MPAPQTEVLVSLNGAKHARFIMGPGEHLIGRNPDCHIRVDADLISRQHAKLTLGPDCMFIEDLGSSNGTLLDGQPIAGRTRFGSGQKIQIGAATIEVRAFHAAGNSVVTIATAEPGTGGLAAGTAPRSGKYDVGAVIARGGMGAILDAREPSIGRSVAMKVMLSNTAPEDAARFAQEARITGQLEHPNIVPVHELATDEHGRPYYTMKMVHGITLGKVIGLLAQGIAATAEKFPLPVLLTIFQKVCDAIAFAHSRGVIHRDLKPENIMLGDYGEVLVMDWGIAKVLTERPTASVQRSTPNDAGIEQTMTGTVMGTPQFMAPEQAGGEIEKLDARTDIYSLGAILYQVLTLHPAVEGRTVEEVLSKVVRGEVAPLVTTRGKTIRKRTAGSAVKSEIKNQKSEIPASLAAVVRKAMSRAQADRYASVPELQADIAAFQSGFATSAEKAGAWKQFTLFVRRHKAASIGAAAVLLIGGTLGTKAVVEGRRAERALATLGEAAPSLAAQARSLVLERKLDEAVQKLDFALTIAPQNAAFHLQRAHLMQASLKLAAAAEGYRRVLALRKDDASAKANLALCEQLLARSNGGELSPADLQSLLRAMLDQKREAETGPLALQLGKGDATIASAIEDAVSAWKQLPGWGKTNGRVSRRGDGSWALRLEGLAISDLGPLAKLRGLPISELVINGNPIEDLSPLSGLPLLKLHATSTKVRSLLPLRGMPLRSLNFNRSGTVTSLDGLQGAPLEWLDIYGNPVADLTPLRGAPLRDLELGFQNQITTLAGLEGAPLERLGSGAEGVLSDISALRGAPLRQAQFPSHLIKDFSVLATCPKLEMISFNPAAPGAAGLRTMTHLKVQVSGGRILPMADFWKEYDARKGASPK